MDSCQFRETSGCITLLGPIGGTNRKKPKNVSNVSVSCVSVAFIVAVMTFVVAAICECLVS